MLRQCFPRIDTFRNACAGRAGRDGGLSLCHTFIHDEDFVVHHSLSHSAGVADSQVLGLLQLLVDQDPRQQETAASTMDTCSGLEAKPKEACDLSLSETSSSFPRMLPFRAYEAIVPIEECELNLDVTRPVIETLLTFLSMSENGSYLSLNNMAYATCTVTMYQAFSKVRVPFWLTSGSVPFKFITLGISFDVATTHDPAFLGHDYPIAANATRCTSGRVRDSSSREGTKKGKYFWSQCDRPQIRPVARSTSRAKLNNSTASGRQCPS